MDDVSATPSAADRLCDLGKRMGSPAWPEQSVQMPRLALFGSIGASLAPIPAK